MPKSLSRESLAGAWRRRLFGLWIGSSILVALYLAIAGPLSLADARSEWYVAAVPLMLMAVMLISGMTWLWLFIVARPRDHATGQRQGKSSPPAEGKPTARGT